MNIKCAILNLTITTRKLNYTREASFSRSTKATI